ncbi:TIGR03960 family B12-binding radical SAM protein [Tumidithrix elongata RA019]|uniref:TIGR03960 family B12-binding radical SAM protein n=1 Tax=Tumidithrix elongata BACA0141 TaxID=2716417 RepID=A0AAW9PTJ1_9CYAN|nr:TIGR03960 family B12-binding radical SAM protein [Tumidithrix elongata RA019]
MAITENFSALNPLITADILKPGRYLGNELGAVHKPWHQAIARWALTYPEIYEVGASNLGHIILYSILNAQDRQLCDRAYLPAPDLAAKLRGSNTPLFAVESQRPLTDFDILGFSLSYELGATNVLEMLDLAGIPLTWQERNPFSFSQEKQQWEYPLIFAGGQTATSNPEPYADFFDFFVLGDGEEVLPEIGVVVTEAKLAGRSRQEVLMDLAKVPGVYVPQFYDMNPEDGSVSPNREGVPKRILRRVAAPIPEHSIGLVPLVETVHDRLTIEIRRGCTRGCRFCQPGMLTRPARDVEPEDVVNTIERAVKETGYNEFSLLSLSCSDYLALPAVGIEIKNRLNNQHINLSLPSQRVDRFDENIANILKGDGRQQGLTFAPEAGTQRLRDVINKGLTDEELLRGVRTAYEQGWDRVKLYFMIGLPTETDEDVIGIAKTISWLQSQCRLDGRKRLNVNVTISNFTPKPHTPFQWHSVSTEDFLHKQKLLKTEFRFAKGVKVNFTTVEISAMEDFVGRGDRRLGAVLKRAWQLGAGMDAWFENTHRAFQAWTTAIEESGLKWEMPAPQYAQALPWDHLDTGIDKQWLLDDWNRAIAAETVPDCSFHGCSKCGVCSPDFGHNIVVPPPPIPAFTGYSQLSGVARQQRLRVTFGKLGSMALISHLDLVRLFSRAMRRADLPIAYTEGFNPLPRIALAKALSLGHSSAGEVADFELTAAIAPAEFQQRLAAQLPPEIPIYATHDIAIDAPSADVTLQIAEYRLTLGRDTEIDSRIELSESIDRTIESLIQQVNAAQSILMPKRSKSGKEQLLEMRDRLFELDLIEVNSASDIQIRYVGSCRSDSTLKPEYVLFMLNQFTVDAPLKLLHVHREALR